MTLTEFLEARIAEDEELARDASGRTDDDEGEPSPRGDEWVAARTNGGEVEVLVALHTGEHRPADAMKGEWGQVAEWEDSDDLPVAEHIARHDPARVLAECAAKRAILAEHELGKAGYVGCTVENDPECMCCSHDGEYPGGWPCATLDALLSVYTEHPDYREEWRR